jgi:hypothetical protein
MADMETFKGAKSTTGGGGKYFKMVCFHCGMPGFHKGGKTCCQWNDLSQAYTRENSLRFVMIFIEQDLITKGDNSAFHLV